MKRIYWVDLISYLFVFLFVYASISKLVDIAHFRILIGQSPLLTHFAGIIAWFIPLIELVISILLVINRFRLIGLVGSFGLMFMFTLYIIAILQFSEHIPCSCGGVLQSLGWTEHLIFNIAFTLLGLLGIYLEYHVIQSTSLKEL